MKMRRGPKALLFAAAAAACESDPEILPPKGQVVLYVTTDAPLPPPPGEPESTSATAVAPLFDRLRIEIFAPGETSPCRDCTREFALDRELVKTGKASFGFAPTPEKRGYRARLSLYRGIAIQQEQPIVQAAITRTVALPVVRAEGIIEAGVFLRVDDVGVPKGDLTAPIEVELGKPDFNRVGSWPGSERKPCLTQPRPGEACVPGGAFWMGDPTIGASSPTFDVSVPRLVVLSPFFVDLTEVTVGAFRESKLARLDPATGLSIDPVEGQNQGSVDRFVADGSFALCNFSATSRLARQRGATATNNCGELGDGGVPVIDPLPPSAYDSSLRNVETDSLPVNCVSWSKAAEFCRSKGRDLLTEAQSEYLAGGLSSLRYPWGNEPPGCEDAVFGRDQVSDAPCRAPGTLGGPRPPGAGRRDRVELGGGAVVDMVGNLTEWVRDTWHRPSESCWTTPLLRDPICATISVVDPPDANCAPKNGGGFGATPLKDASYTVKGGAYTNSTGEGMRASTRGYWWAYARFADVGFRCVRADQ